MLVESHRRPRFSEAGATELARRLYCLPGPAQVLPSERDQNFLLRSGEESFVLKIAAGGESEPVLDLQNQAMHRLADSDPAVPCPLPRRTTAGEWITRVEGPDGDEHLVRLLTWLPGKPLARVRPHSPELLRGLGCLLGRMSRALDGFDHPAARRELYWDLAGAPRVIEAYVGKIADPERRALVEDLLARHVDLALPRMAGLRSAVVHHDANDYNVIVCRDATGETVPGVIDFGDMVHSKLIHELAVGTAYAMLAKPDPLSAAVDVVRAYHEAFPLQEEEVGVLFHLMVMRLCMSVCIAAHQQAAEPDNEYLAISESGCWELLGRLRPIPPRLAERVFRQACDLPSTAHDTQVLDWLRRNGSRAEPVLSLDPAREKAVVFDLGVESLELPAGFDPLQAGPFTDMLFGRMRDAGVRLGIGRYDEVRSLYSTDVFAGVGNEGPQWRTVHLGIDLFAEAGTEVRAPLEARVHSMRDNAAPLDYGPTIVLEHAIGGATFYTLYGHLSADSLEGLTLGATVEAGTTIGRIGDASVNGGWPPHLHFQVITEMLAEEGNFAGVALHSRRRAWLDLCPDPNLLLGIPDLAPAANGADSHRLVADRAATLGPSLSLSYRRPLHIVRGRGQYLYDETARQYLDGVNNVPHVGHSHPRVVAALSRQAAVLNTNTRYLHDNLVRYAARLCAILPDPLQVCFFVNSGSEANELALRLAAAHTGRRQVAVLEGGYHGNTTGCVAVSSYKFDGPGGAGAPSWVHRLRMPDPYRGAHRDAGPYVAELEEVSAKLAGGDDELGAFLSEPILSCGGQIVPPAGYLAGAYSAARRAGAVCIADEVQIGFGRVGTHMWAFEAQEAVPDIVTMGKPIGNGHPMGAVVTTREIADSFANGMEYFNTFGGNPVSCAVGLAVLDVLEEERLQEQALRVGGELLAGLSELMRRHPLIGDVRGQGLFLGVELVTDRESRAPAAAQASYMVNRMRERGILLSTDGPLCNVIKIKPPLPFDSGNAAHLLESLGTVLAEDAAQPERM